MNIRILLFTFFCFLFSKQYVLAQPVNDNCNAATNVLVNNGALAYGTYTSPVSDLTNATVQTGESFAPSIFIAGQNQKSVWYKFTVSSKRKVRISLKQSYNNIIAGDVGFAVYNTQNCLPTTTNLSTQFSALETFGNTTHPCVDSGTYLVQVSARNSANGPIYLELEVEPTDATYDNMNSAYDFGVLNQHRKAVNYDISCHSVEYQENLCNNYMGNSGNLKTSWHTFTTPAYIDYINFALSGTSVFTLLNQQHVIGFRVFQGNARTSTFSALTPVTSCDTFMSDGQTVSMKRFLCGTFLPNTTYSVQLLFKPEFIGNIKFAAFAGGIQAANGPTASTTSLAAANQLGVLTNTTRNVTDYFACNAMHTNNNCGPTKPAAGISYNGINYNISNYFTFTINQSSNLTIAANMVVTSPNCGDRLIRLFNTGLTNNCNDLTLSSLYDEFINSKTLTCVPPGNYTIQVLSTSSDVNINNAGLVSNNTLTCIQSNLGRAFRLSVTKSNAVTSQFRLFQNGAFNNINNGNALTLNNIFNSTADNFGCEESVLPNNINCNQRDFDRAKYRQFTVADSGTITIASLPTSFALNGQTYAHTYQLFQGNANALAAAQNSYNPNQNISGLTSYSNCITTSSYTGCIVPGTYSFVEYGDSNFVNRSSSPTFRFRNINGLFGNYNNPNNLGDIVQITGPTGGDVSGTIDTFTCNNNAITINGVAPCPNYTKAIYREFYVSDSVFLRIRSSNSQQLLTFFEGRISTAGPSGLNPIWECFSDRKSVNCEYVTPGWYTVVSYGMGPTYGINNYSGTNHIGTTNNITITVEFDCEGPKYNRPFKAAIDSVSNTPFLITWNQAADTGAYPNTSLQYQLPKEQFNCTVDTPFTFTAGCGTPNFNRVAYYVFELTQPSYLNIRKGSNYYTQVYAGNIRIDSFQFPSRTPIANCNNSNNRLELCNMQPGVYTLVIYANNRCIEITPEIIIDKVGTSRFDFAKNAYDFDIITPNNTFQSGKIGDVNPLNPNRPASSDIFYCTTGAYSNNPTNAACNKVVNNSVYTTPLTNKNLGLSGVNQLTRRNLWYTFVVDRPGTYTVKVDSKTPGKNVQLPFAIYKSDVNGSLPFAQVVATNQVDSTTAQGLSHIVNNNCSNPTNTISFTVNECTFNQNQRYYILVENSNTTNANYVLPLNFQVDVAIKSDTSSASLGTNDYYINASNIGIVSSGLNTGAQSSYVCATRNSSYPSTVPSCGQRTLWYKFQVPTALNAEARIRLELNGSTYAYASDDFILYRELTPNDSTSTGLVEVPLSSITNYQKACISTGTYYLLLTGCNRTNQTVIPEILIDTLLGDYCFNAVPISVTGAGNFNGTVNVDCHTIGTDYGEFNTNLTCPVNGITSEYKSSWFRININTTDTVDIGISLQQNLNIGANQIFYRLMTGDCNAMTEQSCIQDILTLNTYLCMMPDKSYYIQVFTPVLNGGNMPTVGSISLNVNSSIHIDTCAPTNYCKPVANFSATVDCDSIYTQNYSTYGNVITYLWDFGDNSNTSYTSVNPSHAFPKHPRDTTYVISLRVVNTDCQDTSWAYYNIFVPATPNPYLGNDTAICNINDSLLLDVTFPGATYLWNTGATSSSIKVGTPGTNTYWVTISYNSCTYSDTIKVYKTSLVGRPSDSLFICEINDTIILDASRNIAGLKYLWSNNTTNDTLIVNNPGLYTVQISDSFCSIIDTFRVGISIDSVFISDTICHNRLPYVWGTQNVNSFGQNVAYQILNNQKGCDSVVFLSLYSRPSDTTIIYDSICSAQLPYQFYNNSITNSGVYTHTLLNNKTCDSIIVLNLHVKQSYNINLPVSVCTGDTLMYNGQRYTSAGSYTHNFIASNECDSIVNLQVTILPYLQRIQYDTICHNQVYTLPSNRVVNTSGVYIDTITNNNSCDSIITTHLFVRTANHSTANITICAVQLPYQWNGINVTTGGNNAATYTTSDRYGCDSTTTLNLTVHPNDTLFTQDTICSSQLPYQFFTRSITIAGTYYHTLTSSLNCDSVIRLQLHVNPSYRDTFVVTICQNETYSYNNTVYNTTGFYTHNFNSTNNCDSIRILRLMVTPLPVFNRYDTICHNESYTLPSNTVVNNAGVYYDTLSRTNLCDSVVITHLYKRTANNGTVNQNICQNQLPYNWNGLVINNGGTAVATFTALDRFGCDSITTLNLTVNPTHNTVLFDTVCSNQLPYVFLGTNINAAGNYSQILNNQFGCDSTINLTLTVLPSYSDTITINICEGESYQFYGQPYNVQGTYTRNFIASNGCDSNKILVLTVNPTSPIPTVTSPLYYCLNDNAPALTANGTNLMWYTVPTGGTGSATAPTPSTSSIGRQVYYVSQNINGCPGNRDSIEVYTSEKIIPNFDIIPDTVNCENDTILFIYTGQNVNGLILEWSWNGANYVHNAHPNYYAKWNTPGNKTIGLFTNNNGCISEPIYKQIQLNQNYGAPELEVEDAYCVGDDVSIEINSIYPTGTSYHWTYNGQNISATTQFNTVANQLGWNYLSVYVVSDKGCPSNVTLDSFYVAAYPEFNLSADVVEICKQDTITLFVPKIDGVTYTYEPQMFFPANLQNNNPGQKSAFIFENGYVYATATNEYGCSTTDSLFINTYACCDMFVPNAFTPNGDGVNDEMKVYATNLQNIQEFSIYNRYGQRVFHTTNQNTGWDGKFNNLDSDAGVYYYYLAYTCSDGSKYVKKGDITLIR